LEMGFKRIVDTDYVPAVSLGGFTYGVSAVELASGYAALYNNGEYREPTCIVKITDAQGSVLIGDEIKSKKVYATNAARMMTACMQQVMETGTGRKLKIGGQIAAGKTGTTTNQKDGWFAGFTAYYTTAVWVGYDLPKAMEDLMGNTYPGRIWQTFMDQIHRGLSAKEFVPYTDTRPPKQEEENLKEDAEGEDGNGENFEGEGLEDNREDFEGNDGEVFEGEDEEEIESMEW
ncbi:MAG: glycosyl transferase, partial [Lachnospiraceae bacterium]|nr:glycosyl transferase [Lachnospiraceae bacterium]